MGNRINASDIADFLHADLIGSDLIIENVCPVNKIDHHKMAFINKNNFHEIKFLFAFSEL